MENTITEITVKSKGKEKVEVMTLCAEHLNKWYRLPGVTLASYGRTNEPCANCQQMKG